MRFAALLLALLAHLSVRTGHPLTAPASVAGSEQAACCCCAAGEVCACGCETPPPPAQSQSAGQRRCACATDDPAVVTSAVQVRHARDDAGYGAPVAGASAFAAVNSTAELNTRHRARGHDPPADTALLRTWQLLI